MSDQNLNDLAAFMVVAKEQNFTRAAKRLGNFTVRTEPDGSGAGGSAWPPLAQPNHPACCAHRSRRAANGLRGAAN